MYPHKKKEVVVPYVHQEFPKWKHHASKASKTVGDHDEEKALGSDWKDFPTILDEADDQAEVEAPKAKRGRPKKEEI